MDLPARFPPEFRLLLACLQDNSDGFSKVHPEKFSPEQWTRFLQLARRHRVEILLASYVKGSEEGFPPSVIENIQKRSLRGRQKNLKLKASLFRILNLLDTSGIRALAIKGPALAMQFYPDPDTRQARDLDILVDPEKIQETVKLLLQHDYVFGSREEERWFTRKSTSFHKVFPHLGMTDSKTGMRLELHWRLFTFREFEPGKFDELWNCKTLLQQDALAIHTLSAADHFRYICLHGLFHGFYQLPWIRDVAMALQHSIPWTEIQKKAAKEGTLAMIQLAVQFAGYFFPAAAPEVLMNEPADEDFMEQARAFSMRCLIAGGQTELTGTGMRIRRARFFRRIHRMAGISGWNYAGYLIRKGWLRIF
ncbi:MAG: nucleotidyltransferase family protein [Bacteroidales bacterium]